MPDSRRSALRVWIPVVISALVQLGTTAAALRTHGGMWQLRHGGTACCDIATAGSGTVAVIPWWVAPLAFLLALAGPALLIWIRRRPGPVLAAIAATAVLSEALLIATVGSIAFCISVLFGIAVAVLHGARGWAWIVAGILWLTPIALYLVDGNAASLFLLVPWTILSLAVLVLPETARNRRRWRAQLLRDIEARRAEEAQAERVRIARELHDVLAHSLSQINVQASVGLHLFESRPEKAHEALANVKESSRQALDEVRQVLGMLRGGEAPLAPEHELADIEALVDGMRARGVATTLSYEVDASRVSAAVQQAAYRIVQEALTNVGKHAAARRVEVALTLDAAVLRLRVADDGIGAAAAGSEDGRGLLGMRERAELLGGTFAAGPRGSTGFEVSAELPLSGAS